MSNNLMRLQDLTEKDKVICDKYLYDRNIINKYSISDLNKIHMVDLYAMMDLDAYRYKEIPAEILTHVHKHKKRLYHPTKSKGPDQAFALVNIARDIFSDTRLRSIYDSSFFHIEMPQDKIYIEEEFYTTFQKCFDEYARFSVEKNVPSLKDDMTSFYTFWRNFKSNRIYIPIDEYYKLNQEERFDYTRNNKENLTKWRNEDILRLKEICRICYRRDPRVRSIEEQLEELRIEKQNAWSQIEISTLKKFIKLFAKVKKNKWEMVTEKLLDATKVKRSVKEVAKKAEELAKEK